jgi:LysR family carnitine catabolism transcriptional activator
MNLTIRQLEILVAIGETLNLTAAAERLGITQPSVSETLKRIEAELGYRLVQRTTRALALTYEGRHVVASARDAVRSLNQTFDAIAGRLEGVHGRVVIAALPSVICTLLPSVIRTFRSSFPGIAVELRDALQDRATALLEDGLVDLAIVGHPASLGPFSFEDVTSDRMHLICHRQHVLAGRATVTWADLVGHDFIAISPASSVRRLTDAGFVQANRSIEPKYEVDQITSAAALAAAGLGITALPSMTFAMFRDTELAMVPITEPTIERRIGLLWVKSRPLSISATRLAESIRNHGGN